MIALRDGEPPQRLVAGLDRLRIASLRASASTMSQQRQIIEHCRDGRHDEHVEIVDLEIFGDDEGGRAQRRRRQRGADAGRGGEPAGGRRSDSPSA